MNDPTVQLRQLPRGVVVFLATLAVGLVTLVSLSEFVLPGLAERRLRADLATGATDVRVTIHAEPAIKLLLGRADTVDIEVGTLRVGSGRAGGLIARADQVGRVDVTAERADVQGLRLEGVRLELRDGAVTASAQVTPDAIKAVLPRGVRFVEDDEDSGTLTFRAGVAAKLVARDGRLVVQPDSLLGRLASYTVFADERVTVESVEASGAGDGPRTVLVRAILD